MDKTQVESLAKLARLKLSPEETEKLSHEFEVILKYVGEVQGVSVNESIPVKENFSVRNVMREEGEGHASGAYTEAILKAAPVSNKEYIKVKKIL